MRRWKTTFSPICQKWLSDYRRNFCKSSLFFEILIFLPFLELNCGLRELGNVKVISHAFKQTPPNVHKFGSKLFFLVDVIGCWCRHQIVRDIFEVLFHNSWSPVLKIKSCLRHALTCRGVYYSFYAIWLAVTCIISFISNWKASGHLSQDVLSAWSCPEDSGLLFFSWFLRNRVDALAKSCYYSCSGFYSLSHKAPRSHLYRSYKIEEHSNTIQTLRLLWSYLSLPDKKDVVCPCQCKLCEETGG